MPCEDAAETFLDDDFATLRVVENFTQVHTFDSRIILRHSHISVIYVEITMIINSLSSLESAQLFLT